MTTRWLIAAKAALFAMLMAGCSGPQVGASRDISKSQHHGHADHGEHEAKTDREVAFAKLSAADRPLAEAQGYCAVTGEPLGTMGAPLRVTVKDEAVFVCCEGCEKQARMNPDKTLAKVNELKAKVRLESAR